MLNWPKKELIIFQYNNVLFNLKKGQLDFKLIHKEMMKLLSTLKKTNKKNKKSN